MTNKPTPASRQSTAQREEANRAKMRERHAAIGAPHEVLQPARSDMLEAEREACAQICDRLEAMMVQGGGETRPGERLAQAARLIRERAAQPFPLERKRLWEQHNDEGEIGWYFDCDGHYIDVERDKDGKYSVYFRNRADESEAWLDQAERAPSGVDHELTEIQFLLSELSDGIASDLPIQQRIRAAMDWLGERATAGNAAPSKEK